MHLLNVFIYDIALKMLMFDTNELDAKITETHINAEEFEEENNTLESKLLENYEFDKFRYYLENKLSKKVSIKKNFRVKFNIKENTFYDIH